MRIHKYIPKFVKIDHYRLTQIFLNLIGNAVKFTDTGSIDISVEWIKNMEEVKEQCFQPYPAYIRHYPSSGPKAIQAEMRKSRQEFTLLVIKNTKKDIIEGMFPKDKRIAFYPTNCIFHQPFDIDEDNLFRYAAEFPVVSKGKGTNEKNLHLQEFYIFANITMLLQLESSKQWFIDGTFATAPQGFQQLLTIVVYLPKWKIFYPACFILATNKTEALYNYAFKALVGLMEEEGFKPDPDLIMCDFEKGLQNSIKKVFKGNDKLVGCFFHYVKALMKKAKSVGFVVEKTLVKEAKMLIGLLKLLAHCPEDKRAAFFEEIETMFKDYGPKFKDYLAYFKKNWLNNPFWRTFIKLI